MKCLLLLLLVMSVSNVLCCTSYDPVKVSCQKVCEEQGFNCHEEQILPKYCRCLESTKNEVNLLSDLIYHGYKSSVRPVYNEDDTINLTIALNSFSLLNMDQTEETVVFSAEFILEWNDVFLTWNPEEYSNLTWLKIKEIHIWKPDVVLSSSISKQTLLAEHERYVDLHYTGSVRQSMYAVYTNLCTMKVNRFPYDSQVCGINIGPWSYTLEQFLYKQQDDVQVFSMPSEFVPRLDEYTGNSEWDFMTVTSTFEETVDEDVGFHFREVLFNVLLKRRPLFYVWVLLIPAFIVTTVCIFGLFIPTNNLGDREERVNLGLTTLLSSAVILQIVADSMPKASALPLLGNFILAEIFVVAGGVILSLFVLILHNRANTRDWRPPAWILAILRLTVCFIFTSRGSRKFFDNCTKHMKIHKNTNNDNKLTEYPLLKRMAEALTELADHLNDEQTHRLREMAWLKFFDRLDTLFLIIFLLGNCILTYVICA